MREVELKSVVDDVARSRRTVEAAGAVLMFEGRLVDLRYGDSAGALAMQDHVLRLRVYEGEERSEAHLDWKGPTRYEDGYKVRDEVSTPVGDAESLARILERIGFRVIRDIERRIAQYAFAGAIIRFEEYPRMDALVEVEGEPDAIQRAIVATGLPREGFNADRLPDFIARFEARTGRRAALSERELRGDYSYRVQDA